MVRALRRWVIRVETHEAHLERRLQGYKIPSTEGVGWGQALTRLKEVETYAQQVRSALESHPGDHR